MRYAIVIIIFELIFLKAKQSFGQIELFGIGGNLGMNFAFLPYDPINNPENLNYGINAGIFCNVNLNSRYNLRVEILYSRNGDYILPEFFPGIEYGKVKLNYTEVPFHFDFYINSFKSTSFLPDCAIEIGGAFVNLFSYFIEDIHGNEVTKQIIYKNKYAFLYQIGTTVYFSKHFGGNIRFSMPLSSPLKDETGLTTTVRLIYRL